LGLPTTQRRASAASAAPSSAAGGSSPALFWLTKTMLRQPGNEGCCCRQLLRQDNLFSSRRGAPRSAAAASRALARPCAAGMAAAACTQACIIAIAEVPGAQPATATPALAAQQLCPCHRALGRPRATRSPGHSTATHATRQATPLVTTSSHVGPYPIPLEPATLKVLARPGVVLEVATGAVAGVSEVEQGKRSEARGALHLEVATSWDPGTRSFRAACQVRTQRARRCAWRPCGTSWACVTSMVRENGHKHIHVKL
jgi:hypothetical protein